MKELNPIPETSGDHLLRAVRLRDGSAWHPPEVHWLKINTDGAALLSGLATSTKVAFNGLDIRLLPGKKIRFEDFQRSSSSVLEMITESPFNNLSDVGILPNIGNGMRGSNGNLEDSLGEELDLMLRDQRNRDFVDGERDLNIYRSGSAPPTVEGSLNAVGSLFRNSGPDVSGISGTNNVNGVLSEEEIRSHPEYLSYYYSHDNVNPRLPPPLLSKEDWRVAQRFQAGTSSFGGIGDWRKKDLVHDGDSASLFSLQPGISAQRGEIDFMEPRMVKPRNLTRQPSAEWLERGTDGLIGLAGVGLGARRKSFADMLQSLGFSSSFLSTGNILAMRTQYAPNLRSLSCLSPFNALLRFLSEARIKMRDLASYQTMLSPQKMMLWLCFDRELSMKSCIDRNVGFASESFGRSGLPFLPAMEQRESSSGGCWNKERSGEGPDGCRNKERKVRLPEQREEGGGVRRYPGEREIREGLSRPASVSGHHSRPVSCSAFNDIVDPLGVADTQAQLLNSVESIDGLHSGATASGLVRVQSLGSTVSHSFASVVGSSLSRSTTPESQLVGRSPGPRLPPVGGRVCTIDKMKIVGSNAFSGLSSSTTDHADLSATLSGLGLSKNRLLDDDSRVQSQLQQEFDDQPNFLFDMPNGHNQSLQQQLTDKSEAVKLAIPTFYNDLTKKNGTATDLNVSNISFDGKMNLPKRTSSSANLYSKVNSAGSASLEGSSFHYENANMPSMNFSGFVPSGYSVNQRLNSVMNNHLDTGAALMGSEEGQSFDRSRNQVGSSLQVPVMNPLYVQYLQRTSDYAAHAAASLSDPSVGRNYLGTSNSDLLEFQKGYLETLLAQQKQQYGPTFLGKSGGLNHGYYGSPAFGLGMPYPGNTVANSVLHSVGPGTPIRQKERISHFPSTIRSSTGGSMGSWHSDNGGNMEETYASSLLEQFKNNKTKCFELSEIGDHVVEFSVDQYGSRFIQQKLETATVEEKNKIFPEIIPHARTLMTDVFGNYVIQKFFEHGTQSQRKELASQLTGHVLPLSLQMYGCRVIQKALEVVDLDQQTHMVAELDGSVMKCVRDQNGNHVIQKCIECVPQDRIQFIISAFYKQVVTLSTHPYGCRVIQRVLEHCDDLKTQRIIMDEILQSVCILAQDQYGNYVVQARDFLIRLIFVHVLQHGKPHERSIIISKLAGQIVKMSQQKFASNVVEKCLTFGGPGERQLLVNEMLGSTDENEPLQAMMKDPFANYVVQKVLETCNEQSRELILSRIKVHLNALKRYTYGKHIVARVEKLVTTGGYQLCLEYSAENGERRGESSLAFYYFNDVWFEMNLQITASNQ
ncbi:hypothetical protein HHK36_011193 [Tetracentron sinense]|uniref:PUM-HD domain-containing protein n=1 Tax=Tetracentron sinense TaxID=13715 RepID=A0A835DK76_TETSI|nr:hypothetical protein HHK36_011193 [Tetracentron sinense]